MRNHFLTGKSAPKSLKWAFTALSTPGSQASIAATTTAERLANASLGVFPTMKSTRVKRLSDNRKETMVLRLCAIPAMIGIICHTLQGVIRMSFGGGLGMFLGGELGQRDLNLGSDQINSTASQFRGATEPYNQFGQSFLNPTAGAIGRIGQFAGSDPNLNYNTFMSNYQDSPGAKYTIGQANAAQENSAAAKGGLLSGANERALGTIDAGISNTFANQAFSNYLTGNQQQFGQLETALGNMFQAIGIGQTATGQQASIDVAQMNQQSALAQARAKNDQSKGSGIGTMFGALMPKFTF